MGLTLYPFALLNVSSILELISRLSIRHLLNRNELVASNAEWCLTCAPHPKNHSKWKDISLHPCQKPMWSNMDWNCSYLSRQNVYGNSFHRWFHTRNFCDRMERWPEKPHIGGNPWYHALRLAWSQEHIHFRCTWWQTLYRGRYQHNPIFNCTKSISATAQKTLHFSKDDNLRYQNRRAQDIWGNKPIDVQSAPCDWFYSITIVSYSCSQCLANEMHLSKSKVVGIP